MKPFGTTTMENRMCVMSDEGSTMSAVVQASRQRAQVIYNPSSGDGSCDPYRLCESSSRASILKAIFERSFGTPTPSGKLVRGAERGCAPCPREHQGRILSRDREVA